MTTTTAKVQAGTSANAEFMDAKGIEAHFGIKRTMAYQWSCEGKIKSISLREPGKVRGKRLYVVQSVRDHLNSLLTSPACADRIEGEAK